MRRTRRWAGQAEHRPHPPYPAEDCAAGGKSAYGSALGLRPNTDDYVARVFSTLELVEMESEPTIQAKAKDVVDSFRLLLEIKPAISSPPKASATDVDDQLARFNIWASNIGVFASGHASLDYRLRDSPEAKSLMIQLLEGLQRFLMRGASPGQYWCNVC